MEQQEQQRKRRRGPAPFEPERLRSRRLSLYATADELAEIQRRAARVGMQPTAFLREAALGRLPRAVPELNREAWEALSRAASNLNQLARQMNFGEVLDLEEVLEELRQFRASLYGARLPSAEEADESED